MFFPQMQKKLREHSSAYASLKNSYGKEEYNELS